LIDRLRDHPRFQVVLGDADLCDRIAKAAPLHDIGKVGIPDAILLKPGKLTTEEFEIMKTHANIGAQAIGDAIRNAEQAHLAQSDQTASRQTVQSLDFLETTRQIAGSHHEKWDGSGYPQGLSGEAIPLPARLMALADVFDALVSKRHYKQALPLPEAVRIMTQGRGRHFDPDIFDAFIESVDTFTDIAQRYADHPTEPFMENTP
jgi:putative two-component system response regulator